ncbi:MAG TPA: hypothetical protein VHW96_21850 [Solirubrobacteraceae bacterium]|jgi:hypothetical protein|nr:hypothetical protein [Solirubrobacteraceae bacterium]
MVIDVHAHAMSPGIEGLSGGHREAILGATAAASVQTPAAVAPETSPGMVT